MAAIEFVNGVKAGGETLAVNGVSFVAEEGTFAVLHGPSGCGKSTTLRRIAGLADMTSGRLLIGGEDMPHTQPSDRHISMVFPSCALFPHLDTRENILFGFKVRKTKTSEQERRLQQVAGIVGLDQHLDRKPSQLSGRQHNVSPWPVPSSPKTQFA